MKRRLLDLFCCAGGGAKGYEMAGFDEIVGVDIDDQPRYPYTFIRGDALEYAAQHAHEFSAIHASPPCQGYSATSKMYNTKDKAYPMLIEPCRAILRASGKPYIMENVVGAPLIDPVLLCGVMFGLKVFRHRLFECSFFVIAPHHHPHQNREVGTNGYCCVAGHGDSGRGRIPADHRTKAAWSKAIGINWMQKAELTQAIPPAYTHYLGLQLMDYLKRGDE